MKSVLVTGAEGFVGHYLVNELLSRGYKVYGTALNKDKLVAPLPGATIIEANICDKSTMDDLFKNIHPDYVYHLAAISSVKFSWEHPNETMDVNVGGTLNLLNSAREHDHDCRILLIGSSEEYGAIDYSVPVKETTPLNPQNPYAISKATQESLGMLYAKAYGMNVMATRSFNHFGPYQAKGFVVSDFCSQVASIERGEVEPIIQIGNLNVKRDFLFVQDVVNFYLDIIDNGSSQNVYNVGSGTSIKIEEILKIILSFSNKKIIARVNPKLFRPIDIIDIKSDSTKLFSISNVYDPSKGFLKKLQSTYSFYAKKEAN